MARDTRPAAQTPCIFIWVGNYLQDIHRVHVACYGHSMAFYMWKAIQAVGGHQPVVTT
jgi:hypothetical protein